ncbi:MAG: DUF2007 domain-containing protein [Flavisolibacter sp.]|jgi:hypothetical protein|nr:DUF2007 domain-containing protein [Flavisolibacter sp.]
MNFISIQSYSNYIDAHIVMGQLEEQGIVCWLKDEYTLTIDPILTNALGGIKLMVAENQVQRALDLLEAQSREVHKTQVCPKCSSFDVDMISSNRSARNWFTAISGFLLGDYAIGGKKVFHCFNCGLEWNKSPESE